MLRQRCTKLLALQTKRVQEIKSKAQQKRHGDPRAATAASLGKCLSPDFSATFVLKEAKSVLGGLQAFSKAPCSCLAALQVHPITVSILGQIASKTAWVEQSSQKWRNWLLGKQQRVSPVTPAHRLS